MVKNQKMKCHFNKDMEKLMSERTKKVTVSLTDEEFAFIAKMAHERDITFNEMCMIILEEELSKLEKTKRTGGGSTSTINGSPRATKKVTGEGRIKSVAKVQGRLSELHRTCLPLLREERPSKRNRRHVISCSKSKSSNN